MSQVRNVSGNDRYVPALGCTVKADEVSPEVPDELLEGLVCQAGVWEDVDPAAADRAAKALAEAAAAAEAEAAAAQADTDAGDPTPAEPTTADAADTEDNA